MFICHCGYKCRTAAEFVDHCHRCEVMQVPLPAAERDRMVDVKGDKDSISSIKH